MKEKILELMNTMGNTTQAVLISGNNLILVAYQINTDEVYSLGTAIAKALDIDEDRLSVSVTDSIDEATVEGEGVIYVKREE